MSEVLAQMHAALEATSELPDNAWDAFGPLCKLVADGSSPEDDACRVLEEITRRCSVMELVMLCKGSFGGGKVVEARAVSCALSGLTKKFGACDAVEKRIVRSYADGLQWIKAVFQREEIVSGERCEDLDVLLQRAAEFISLGKGFTSLVQASDVSDVVFNIWATLELHIPRLVHGLSSLVRVLRGWDVDMLERLRHMECSHLGGGDGSRADAGVCSLVYFCVVVDNSFWAWLYPQGVLSVVYQLRLLHNVILHFLDMRQNQRLAKQGVSVLRALFVLDSGSGVLDASDKVFVQKILQSLTMYLLSHPVHDERQATYAYLHRFFDGFNAASRLDLLLYLYQEPLPSSFRGKVCDRLRNEQYREWEAGQEPLVFRSPKVVKFVMTTLRRLVDSGQLSAELDAASSVVLLANLMVRRDSRAKRTSVLDNGALEELRHDVEDLRGETEALLDALPQVPCPIFHSLPEQGRDDQDANLEAPFKAPTPNDVDSEGQEARLRLAAELLLNSLEYLGEALS